MMVVMGCGLSIAQMAKPVKMNATFNKISETEGEIVFEASIDPGWHMYSTNVVEDGPNPTVIHFDNLKGAKTNGPLKPVTKPIQQFDPIFDAELFFFEKSAKLVQKVTFTGGPYEVEGYIEYSACNDQNCTPPTTTEFKYSGEAKGAVKDDAKDAKKDEKKNEANADEKTAEEPVTATPTLANTTDSTAQDSAVVIPTAASDYWTPVIDQLKAFENGGKNDVGHSSLWMIFLLGLLGGLVALITPCVWPIIPMTVSFFLHRSGDKKKGVKDAVVYGISIVIIYVALGLIVTWIFGASALNNMATNAVFNIFFFLLLVVFAASFFGAFEITLPSSWSSAVDSKAEKTGGLLGIFLMAFTLTLVSFSCTGPIIGFLLVEVSTMGSIIAPTIGMLGFAVALALPFTLFAMFPSWLKSAPKSGGWMNVVKVTLGFIELAFALKFLSVADLTQGWRILDRETFLA
ncbi:MAG: thiol:disulfide interchange protein, partial [Bacteroidaceae bacterium]|nr:thiol:disulfide interchange protein [Bacteroidaceae bacterium]